MTKDNSFPSKGILKFFVLLSLFFVLLSLIFVLLSGSALSHGAVLILLLRGYVSLPRRRGRTSVVTK